MKVEQMDWAEATVNDLKPQSLHTINPQLVLLLGSTSMLKNPANLETIKIRYPNAWLLGCSTAGEIYKTHVYEDSLISTAIHFEHTRINGVRININETENSYDAGQKLAQALDRDGLVHAFVLSDGLNVNGSDLVRGLSEHLPANVNVTGGLSGDGDRFNETFVMLNSLPEKNTIALIGFYGDRLKVGYASFGGWDPFGPERLITRSNGNVLYELDGKSALELYKNYLGKHAGGLPATGLLFPLSIRTSPQETAVVRTILGIDDDLQSMIFAGDVPEGAYARLMKANFDRLIDGAVDAAKSNYHSMGSASPELAILISCVGRKMVLKQRIEEEVEAVQDELGKSTVLTGFYSYGEISPFSQGAKSELHNQTMTITTFREI
ncbi:FIST C-terminal domain-containing protein [candidate division KSB1 bacterium]|nr:FIST C-terminal domain-containing protein [candidate division KSB1 bacterium]